MSQVLFADTFYWVAFLNPRDNANQRVTVFSESLGSAKIVTTEEVLTEVLNFLSGGGVNLRRKTALVIRHLIKVDNSKVTVLPQSHDRFLQGLELYESRLDKGYSLTDCISMVVMKELGIQNALTRDHHFTQEGFRAVFAD